MPNKPKDAKSTKWADTDGSGGGSQMWALSGVAAEVLSLFGVIFLMVTTPAFTMLVYQVHDKFNGSLWELYEFGRDKGFKSCLQLWSGTTTEAWTVFAVFGIIQALLQLYFPAKTVNGPVSPKGNTPVYKDNGVSAYLATLVLFFAGWWLGWFSPARVYDILGEILTVLNVFAILLCVFLTIKGVAFPSSTDAGSTGSIVYDFYWGTELYPRIGKHFDIKVWTNCRMGMMSWAILPLCYVAKQHQLYGHVANSMIVSVALMQIYVFKFFWWEAGYWNTMDIAHDRAGYYLCWGCLNWVPCIYTSPAMYLVKQPLQLSGLVAGGIFAAGILCIYVNYDADRQRQVFRAKEGRLKIWGKAPRMIVAKYQTGTGETKKSLLLVSGWWGLSRHFHYVPEILAAFFWTMPGLFNHALPYFYVFFLTLLLTDRSFRDDQRCHSKYGEHWEEYRRLVPYKMVPGIF
ncbi:hypothetical protein BSKO_01975 [Bryopsis sp. KO-2023]|nr:hypothetical protein BSKO_01975 [Bryopsis sp. KO-2023]